MGELAELLRHYTDIEAEVASRADAAQLEQADVDCRSSRPSGKASSAAADMRAPPAMQATHDA